MPAPSRPSRVLVRVLAVAALTTWVTALLEVAPARAATSANQTVAGATVGTVGLTLASGAAALTGVSPGSTATGTGTATIVDTGGWTLSVADQSSATTAGHLVAAAGATCSGSESALLNPLTVTATGAAGTVNPSGAVSLTSVAQPLATGTASAVVTTGYSDPIGSAEQMVTGCVYSLTAVYTLQG